MPYCTIEEAWNQSLNPELSKFQDENKKKDYEVEYKNSKIYDESGKSVTNDKKCSAHFEHTITITDNGPEILTK